MATDNDIAAEFAHLKQQQAMLLRAVRISLALMLVTLAVTCVRAALTIPTMSDFFRDMLPGAALPVVTQFVLGHTSGLLLLAILLALVGLGLLMFAKTPGRGIVTATVVIVVLFVQWHVVTTALQSPLTQIMGQLGEPTK